MNTFLEKYIGADNNILVRHNACGCIYSVRPSNFLYGKRCPKCMESGGEKAISLYLDSNNIRYQRQYSFKNCKYEKVLRFDFATFDENKKIKYLIEYDGRQHFEPIEYFGGSKEFIKQQAKDRIKNNYCKQNDIELIRIPYTEFDNIEEILEKCL